MYVRVSHIQAYTMASTRRPRPMTTVYSPLVKSIKIYKKKTTEKSKQENVLRKLNHRKQKHNTGY